MKILSQSNFYQMQKGWIKTWQSGTHSLWWHQELPVWISKRKYIGFKITNTSGKLRTKLTLLVCPSCWHPFQKVWLAKTYLLVWELHLKWVSIRVWITQHWRPSLAATFLQFFYSIKQVVVMREAQLCYIIDKSIGSFTNPGRQECCTLASAVSSHMRPPLSWKPN